MKVLAVGGGSGGHVTPVVAVVDELKQQLGDDSLIVNFVCDASFEAQARRIMATATVPVKVSVIQAGKLRRYRHFRFWTYLQQPSIILSNLFDVIRIGVGFMQSLWLCVRIRPDVVFAKGGYVCLPVGWAARILRIPLVLHDSDARPGLTNRLLSPAAAAIATGYPLKNYSYDITKSTYVGVPVRSEYVKVTTKMQDKAKKELGVDPKQQLLVAFGGGLGSRSINTATMQAYPSLKARNIHTILITGAIHEKEVADSLGSEHDGIDTHTFVMNLHTVIAAADLIVTRASATALQELAAMQKAVIAVPARQLGDQHYNADYFKAEGAAIVLTDDELRDGKLESEIVRLLSDATARNAMASKIHSFARPKAARDVADMLLAQVGRS